MNDRAVDAISSRVEFSRLSAEVSGRCEETRLEAASTLPSRLDASNWSCGELRRIRIRFPVRCRVASRKMCLRKIHDMQNRWLFPVFIMVARIVL